MKTCVIGNGPLGSSIARSLSDRFPSSTITLIAPSSSQESSHNDRGRIARGADAEGSEEWSVRNVRALKMFPGLQARSGVDFYHEVGSLFVGDDAFLSPARRALEATTQPFVSAMPREEMLAKWPFLRVPVGCTGVFEEEAGYINPLQLIEANNKILVGNGGVIVKEKVESLSLLPFSSPPPPPIPPPPPPPPPPSSSSSILVHLSSPTPPLPQSSLTFDNVIVACGGHTNLLLSTLSLPPPLPSPSLSLPFRISRRTVALVPVEPGGGLEGMPCVKMQVKEGGGSEGGGEEGGSAHDRMEAGSV